MKYLVILILTLLVVDIYGQGISMEPYYAIKDSTENFIKTVPKNKLILDKATGNLWFSIDASTGSQALEDIDKRAVGGSGSSGIPTNLWDNNGNSFSHPDNKIGTLGNSDVRVIANGITSLTVDSATRNVIINNFDDISSDKIAIIRTTGVIDTTTTTDLDDFAWVLGGNDVTGLNETLGTTNADALSIITDSVERVNISSTGSVVIKKDIQVHNGIKSSLIDNLTSATNDTLFSISCVADSSINMTISYGINATDGDTTQSESGVMLLSASNYNGTLQYSYTTLGSTQPSGVLGTLTKTLTCSLASNVVYVIVNVTSSISPSVLRIRATPTIHSDSNITKY